MHGPAHIRVERQIEFAAAILFGGAVGYATYLLLGAESQVKLAYACVAAFGTFLLCFGLLSGLSRRPQFDLPSFAPRVLEFSELEELLLTPADRSSPPSVEDELLLTDSDRLEPETEPLLLDDVLRQIGPDARVVRLFDRKAMPTPGEMKSQIDDHLQRGVSTTAYPDASEALSNALAELRRSLR